MSWRNEISTASDVAIGDQALVAMGYERDTADQRIEDLQQDVRDIVGTMPLAIASKKTQERICQDN